MSEQTYTVMGATGNIGGRLAERLLASGVRVRAVGRVAAKLQRLAAKGAEVVSGDATDAAFLTRAFRGAHAIFVMIPPRYDAPDFRVYQARMGEAQAEAIRKAGVTHVVNLSSVGAHLSERTGPILGLHDQEQRLDTLVGVAVLHLRPAYFMENHLFSIGLIKGQGINGSAMRPDVPIPQIATIDIAARATERMLAPAFSGRNVEELLGPADVTQLESTRILGAAIGKPDLAYVQFPYEAAEQALRESGLSASVAAGMVEMNRGFNEGWILPQSPRSLASTTLTSLAEFAASVFAPAFQAAG